MEIGIDPIAFSIGPIDIAWYGLMVAVAVLFGVIWAWYFLTRKGGVSTDFVLGAAILVIPLGVVGARLVHVIDKFDFYRDNPAQIVGFEGLAIFGAVLGGILGAWLYCKGRKAAFGPLADLAIPGVVFAQAIGRIGCTINGCCYGIPTTSWFSFIYTHPNTHGPLGVPTHPTPLYELMGDLVIFALLFWVFRGRVRPAGSIFAIFLFLWSALTLGVRFWRGDIDTFAGPIQEGQLIALIVMIASGIWLLFKARWVGQETDLVDKPQLAEEGSE
ncbi:MAG: prolipoprotein diacylglyceryl transferase [Dehalococcoidia bacterium]|nr:prolipoprotein diacylglyceryl transferase [Dehalococcoidia bacterium]